MKLVVDNVAELPVINLNDVAAAMRETARRIEEGEFGCVENATFVTEGELGVMSFHWGLSGNAHERVGILHSAIYGIMKELHGE